MPLRREFSYSARVAEGALGVAIVRALLAAVSLARVFTAISPAQLLTSLLTLVFFLATVLASVSLLAGLRCRESCLVLGFLTLLGFYGGELFIESNAWGRSMNLFFLGSVLLLLAFTPCGERLTLFPARERSGTLRAVRLIRLQVCAMYFWAGVFKLRTEYLGGYALETIWIGSVRGSLGYRHTAEVSAVFGQLAAASAVAEILLALLFFFPRSRRAAIWLGILFHLGTAAFLNVGLFAAAAISTYVLFLDPNWLEERFRGWAGSR